MEFERCGSSDTDLVDYAGLFAACFPGANKLSNRAYLRWLYVDNPAGKVVGFNARDNGRLAAHYACIPISVRYEGSDVRALLSLNTATHPDFQGKGLFTRLADLTYATGADEGNQLVYGVANANSTPGFLRKLGFGLVGQLESRIGIGQLGSFDWRKVGDTRFSLAWPQSHLEWRLANPENPVKACRTSAESIGFMARTPWSMIDAWAQMPARNDVVTGNSSIPFPRIWLGLIPNQFGRFQGYPCIPDRLRPSPLNLIVKGLGAPVSLERDDVFMSFLDFDAF